MKSLVILEEGPGWYITNRPCKRNHIGAKRSSHNGCCLECASEQRAKRLLDPEFKRKQRAQAKVLRDSNPEFKKKRYSETKIWLKENPDKTREYRARRRTSTDDKWPADLIQLLLSEQGNLCSGCLAIISADYTVDHVVAVKLGGSNEHSNIQLLCRSCNSSKSAKSMAEWLSTLKGV